MKAGFAESDITPPVGTRKVGWLIHLVGERILDHLFARAAVIESGGERIAFVAADILSLRWREVSEIRRRIEQRYCFPGDRIMVSATHNHAGPAVLTVGDAQQEPAYTETFIQKAVQVFGQALENLEEAEIGLNSTFEFRVAHNRRVRMRSGIVVCHGTFRTADALCLEGVTDPEVAVLAARKKSGRLLGVLVNFACHPTHHGGGNIVSAGFPGVLAQAMKERGCPVTLFVNGTQGNLHTANPAANGAGCSMEEAGRLLAEDVGCALKTMKYRKRLKLNCTHRTVKLPYRKVTKDEINGTVKGAQRFVDPKVYDRTMPGLLAKIKAKKHQLAEVQAFGLDGYAFVSLPGEVFVEIGLKIKEGAYPAHALVAGLANGMVGYVPHREAYARGGYETTFTNSSKLEPEAGEILADTAIALVRKVARTRHKPKG